MSHVTLLSLNLDSGTRYFSHISVKHPTRWYEGRVLKWGTISRSIPQPPSIPIASDITIDLANYPDMLFSTLRSTTVMRKRTASILTGEEDASVAGFATLYTGKIVDVDIKGGICSVHLRDITFDSFEQYPTGIITSSAFANLPGNQLWSFRPIIYGAVTSAGKSGDGALPCPYVDTVNFRYLVAQHACKTVHNVYKYGVLLAPAAYSVVEVAIGGVTHTLIDFTTDQEDVNRPDEITITADVSGITDTGLSSGTLIGNPMRCLEHYHLNYIGHVAGDLDATSITDTANKLDALKLVCSAAIVRRQTHKEIVARFLRSFNIDEYPGKDGKLKFFSFGTEDSLASGLPAVTDNLHILKGSYEQETNRKVINRIVYNYNYHWAKDYFFSRPTFNDTIEQTALGSVMEDQMNLWYVADEVSASTVVQDRLFFQRDDSDDNQFDVPLDVLVSSIDLTTIVALTHFEGVSSAGSGYSAEPFKVFEIQMDLDNNIYTIKGVKTNITRARSFVLGDRTVLPNLWTSATEANRLYGYLCDRATQKFSDGVIGKRLYSRT